MDDPGLPTSPTLPTPPSPAIASATASLPPVQPETPTIVTPKKKFPAKLVAGALMMLLLIGGAYLGVSQVQKKQTTESQAEGNICSGPGTTCVEFCQNCRKSGGTCDKHAGSQQGEEVWGCTEDIVKQGCYDRCILDITCKSQFKCLDVNGTKRCVNPSCIESESCACASPSPTPTPSPEASPGPSPSPLVGLACVDLTKDVAAPKVGDTVTFTCESTAATAMSPVAFFRYSTDNGVNFSGAVPAAGIGVNPTTHQASYDITINQSGDWEVQCRVCTDSGATGCTDWGKALTSGTL